MNACFSLLKLYSFTEIPGVWSVEELELSINLKKAYLKIQVNLKHWAVYQV